jgi:hypothetical protein
VLEKKKGFPMRRLVFAGLAATIMTFSGGCAILQSETKVRGDEKIKKVSVLGIVPVWTHTETSVEE